MDSAADITIDISGSDGAQFISMSQSPDTLTKTVRVEANATEEIAKLRLYGDWELKVKFTYQVYQVTKSEAQAFRTFVKLHNSSATAEPEQN